MSSLIRPADMDDSVGRDGPSIRSLADPSLRRPAPAPLAPAQMLSPSDARIAELAAELEATRELLARAREEAREDAASALKEGRRLALEEFRRNEAAALDLLASRLSEGAASLSGAFDRAERSGLALARAALSRVLGPQPAREGLMTDILRYQMHRLRAEQVLSVKVSADEFGASAGLSELKRALAGRQIDLVTDPALAPGDCRLVLRLGELEVGPDAQWDALCALFTELAEE